MQRFSDVEIKIVELKDSWNSAFHASIYMKKSIKKLINKSGEAQRMLQGMMSNVGKTQVLITATANM